MGRPTPESSGNEEPPTLRGRTGGSILIVDDSGEWRTRVREMLEKQPELQIVGEACDGLQGVRRAAELNPDLVLLDLGMPVLSGLIAADHIKRVSPLSKIVFLSQESDTEIRDSALATGAHGYVLKMNAGSKLLSTITSVLAQRDSVGSSS